MVKVVFCIHKRPDLDDETFRKYWFERHGSLIRSLADSLNANKYVQSHTIHRDISKAFNEERGMSESYDGIAEIWWDNIEVALEALGSPAGQEANKRIIEDEANFIDPSRCTLFITEEHVIFGS